MKVKHEHYEVGGLETGPPTITEEELDPEVQAQDERGQRLKAFKARDAPLADVAERLDDLLKHLGIVE